MESSTQRYIAYRSEADICRVRFFGGPLDGQEITTDVRPDCEFFVHHVGNQKYTYQYKQLEPAVFRAVLFSFETPERPQVRPPGLFQRIANWLRLTAQGDDAG